MWKNGAPDFIIKVNMLLCRVGTFLFLIYKIGDWSLNDKLILVKTYPNIITLVLENMLDGNITILGNRKKYVTSIILQTFLEILLYRGENPLI